MKNFWKKFGWTCLTILPTLISILAQLGLGILLSIVFTVIGMLQQGGTAEPDMELLNAFVMEQATKYSGALIFFYHIIAIIGFGIWFYFGCGRPKFTNPFKTLRGKCAPATILTAFGLCLFANAFVLVGQYIAPAAIEAYMELMEAAGLGVDTFAILASIILAPIGEEILCRGLTWHYAEKIVADMKNRTAAFWIVNCLQALMFGVMHMNLIQGMYAFILGLGIGWLRKRYNSLYPAILAHFVVNFSSTYIVGYPISMLPETCLSYVLLMVVSIVIIGVGILLAKEKEIAEA